MKKSLLRRIKNRMIGSSLFVVCCIGLLGNAHAQVSLTASVGTASGTYSTLQEAFDSINTGAHQGTILISITGNTTESASAVLNASGTGLSNYAGITIQPSGGAHRSITGSVAGALISLAGADNIVINGLNTGGNALTIENSNTGNTSVSTIEFSDDASNNTISNCTILGSSTSLTLGTIVFGTGTTSGNDNNTISNNTIDGSGGNLPVNAIYCSGTTTAGIENSSNTISGNNIANFFNATLASTGVLVSAGATDWIISNNLLYQTASRTYTAAAVHRGINILTGNNHLVSGNTIGYSSSSASGTYTMISTSAITFVGIDVTVGTTTTSSLQGNTITAIDMTSASSASTGSGVLCGIRVGGGNTDIGTVTGNTIGATSGTASLVLTTSASTGTIVGIAVASTSNTNVQNNSIGAFLATGTGAAIASGVIGITVSAVPTNLNIVGNTIGNATANNMVSGIAGTTTATTIAAGISAPFAVSSTVVASYSNNTIQNFASYGKASSYVRGITTATSGTSGAFTIDGNTIHDLSTNSNLTSATNGLTAAAGIHLGTGLDAMISDNTIYNIAGLDTASTNIIIAGITCANGTNTTVQGNKIYNITHAGNGSVPTATSNPTAAGIVIRSGTTSINIINNMISLGTAQTTNTSFVGIYGNHGSSPNPTCNILNNTVHIAGTVTSGGKSSFCFLRNDLGSATARTVPVNIKNNIFDNTRTGGTGKHYAISNNFGSTTASATGWGANAANYNVLNSADPNTVGNWTTDRTFATWKTASAGDANSYSGITVNFVNGANDLHLNMGVTPTYMESNGLDMVDVTADFDGDARPGPAGSVNGGAVYTDIGADEFDGVGLDGISPVLSYSNLGNSNSLANRTVTNFLTTVDLKIDTTLGTRPRLYFKKRAEANAFVGNTSSDNGWKYVEASNTTSPFSFTINYSLLTSAVAINDTIQYFAVAQDMVPFVSAFPSAGFVGTSVSAITAAPTTPSEYIIVDMPLAGPYNVGLSQPFTSLTQAVANLVNRGVTGPVTFMLTDAQYDTVTTGEIFPITLSAFPGSSTTNTVTIVPSIASRIVCINNNPVFKLSGGSNYIIDGRIGGTGGFVPGNNLIIENTNKLANTIKFENDADSNRLLYVDIKGADTLAAGNANAGVINIGTTTGTTGNDFNTIRYCDIHESSAGFPAVAISAIGTATTVEMNNDGNTIDSNNIYNFYSPNLASAAIYVGLNNGGWQINSNKFYQTSSRTHTTAAITHRVLWITPNTGSLTSASGFEIRNNYIGGDNASGTGWYDLRGAVTYLFNGMDISVGIGTPTVVQGNTITNINDSTTATASNAFAGINLANGNVDVLGNLIGSRTTNGAISFYGWSATTGGAMGIRTGGGAGTFNISGNIISGIDLHGMVPTNNPEFFGLNIFNGANVNVYNNLIGDTSLANSIHIVSTSASSASLQRVTGIFNNPNAAAVDSIYNNVIANITNEYAGASPTHSLTKGIVVAPTAAGTFVITGNTIKNISTASQTTGVGFNATLVGIGVNYTAGTFTVSGNTISGLTLAGASTTAAVQTTGIYYSVPTSGTNILSRNFIHSQSLTAANPFATINGIDVANGNGIISNNMIRLGVDGAGIDITTACTMRGITKNSGNARVYFNTVYIGGSNVNFESNRTYAFQRTGAGTDTVQNNIFYNTRLNASTGGGHFAVGLNNNTNLNQNFNLLTGDTIGLYNGVQYDELSDWKSGSGVDVASISSALNFVNATGTGSTLDLHIDPAIASSIESSGVVIDAEGTDIDFDGQTRSGLTPVDLGADAGNFIPSDIAPPIITYTELTNTPSTTDRILTATITDATGVYTVGANKPRVYFKKTWAGTWFSAAGNLTAGTTSNGTWEFTISSSTMGGIVGDDSVYYYVVAQDSTAFNTLSSFPGGAEGSSVNAITVEPTTLSSYKITPIIGGVTYLVGTGNTYTNLTGANGMFNYLNTALLNGDITIQITSDIEETGLIGLNELTETGTGGYKVRIEPAAAVVYNITGTHATANSALIRLDGADRVNIDGRFSGAGQYLRFMNRSQAAVTMMLRNDADNDTIQNCIVEGVATVLGTITFSTSNKVGGTGNDSNAIIGCIIRDTLGTLAANNIPNTGISNSGTNGLENDNNTIDNNEIFNFGFNAVNMTTSGTGDFWTISNNKIYQVIVKNNAFRVLYVNSGSGHTISNNSIGGSAADRSGSAMTSTVSSIMINITSTISTANPIVISGNTISNIGIIGTTPYLKCIQIAGGNVTVSNNIIGGGMMPYDTLRNSGDGAAVDLTGGTVTVSDNLISDYRYYAGTTNYRHAGMYVSTGTHTITNNTITRIEGNNATTSIGSYVVNGIYITGGTNHTISGNQISRIKNIRVGTGAYTAVGIFVAGSSGSNISGNRIFNIFGVATGTGTSAPRAIGIYTSSAGHQYAHNQITLGDSTSGETIVYGLMNITTTGVSNYYYNSVYVNGTVSSGANKSYCLYRTAAGTVNAYNNIFYNKRATLGTGNMYAVGSVNAITSANLNYNLFVVGDTAKIAELGTTAQGWSALNSLYTTSANTNWAENTSAILPEALFTDTLVGDLGIVTTNPEAWYANGKGIALDGVSGDYANAAGVRSTSIANGATDIGSVEFTPSSLPPLAFADNVPVAATTTTYYVASRAVAKLEWDIVGSLPSSVDVRYYSGVNPSNVPASTTYMNAYWDVQAGGGSGFESVVTLMADSAILGTVANLSNLDVARYTGTSANWDTFATTSVNTTTGFFNTTVFTGSLGIFTGTDGDNNPVPVTLTTFVATAKQGDVIVDWSTVTETNNRGFEIERSLDGRLFESVGFVKGAGNSNKQLNYTYTDNAAFAKADANVLYYRLKQVDMNGNFSYSQIARVSINSKELNAVSAYPNPFNNELQLSFRSSNEGTANVRILNIQGMVVAEQNQAVSSGMNRMDVDGLSDLNKGLYFVQLTVNGETTVVKLMKY